MHFNKQVRVCHGRSVQARPSLRRRRTSPTRTVFFRPCFRCAACSRRRRRKAVASGCAIIVNERRAPVSRSPWCDAPRIRGAASRCTPPATFPTGGHPSWTSPRQEGCEKDGDTGRLVWPGTLFGAIRDAADGIRWPAGSPASDDRRRRTQGRRVDAAGRLLGVQPGVTERQREQIASRLDVPTMTLRTAAAMWSTCWTARGKAIVAILVAIVVDGSILDRLLGAGHLGGLWHRPHRWEQQGSSWIVGRSPAPERCSEIAVSGRGPPPTNSPVAGLRSGDPPSGS